MSSVNLVINLGDVNIIALPLGGNGGSPFSD